MGRRCWRTSPFTRLHKKQVTGKDKMYRVTYKYIRLKCYLNFVLMAPHEVAGSPMLARAIDKFYSFLNDLKKFEDYLCSSTYSFIRLVTICFTVVFCFNATILKSVLKSSSICITKFLCSLILITTLFCYITICKVNYKYIFKDLK